MKRFLLPGIAAALVFSLVLACGSTGSAAGGMTPGTYRTEQRGYVDQIKVETVVDGSKIVSVRITENHETNGIGSFAIQWLPERIVQAQSVGIDIVSGASFSSRAILGSVTEALRQAGADVDKFSRPPPKPPARDQELSVDVIIVGAGGAGLTAGVEARVKGKDTLIIEKMDIPGGNTIRSSGGFNVAGSPEQVAARRGRYSIEDFITYTMEGGHNLNNRELVTYMIQNSSGVVDWLKTQGMNPQIGETYASYTVDGEAKGLILDLLRRYESQGGKIMYGVRGTDIIMNGGRAAGIVAVDKLGGKLTIRARAVILASGGFGGDLEMCARLDPSLEGFVTDNSLGATGDGIKMAEAIGAATVDMEQIQSHPTIHQASSTMLTEGIRGSGGILINTAGKRFTNENTYRDVVSAAILSQDQAKACILFNKELMDHNPNVQGYYEQGLITPYNTLDDVARYMTVDPAVLKQTVATWNTYVANKNDPEFASSFSWIRDLSQGPYFALWVAPGIHHTMGGIKINVRTEVLSAGGSTIPGLFACGEVTGGVHGGNRVGGNAILDILLYGRVAGENAAAYIR
ncbi:MAG: flavocytochrome c [Spirochaetaceae bacterium]|jgi:fumarate reductase flavoprotein subunit|nr:flavocytochrome c [Spirochaetaceae bacterium]